MIPRNHVLDAGPKVLRYVVMATNCGTKIAITGFVWTIGTRLLVMEGVWVVGQQNADIADTLQLRDVAMATIFVFLYMGCTLAPPGEYDWILRVRQRCGLMSNYFEHLLHFPWVLDDAKCIVATAVSVCVCLSVCLSLAAFPHYRKDPDVTWGNGRGCPLVVH